MSNPFESGLAIREEGNRKIVSYEGSAEAKQEGWDQAVKVPEEKQDMAEARVFDARKHFAEVKRRIREIFNPQGLFEQLHPNDQKALVAICNMDNNHPNNRFLAMMLVKEIAAGNAHFMSGQPHASGEIRLMYLEHCKRFRSAAIEGLSNDFLLGTKAEDALETIKSRGDDLYAISLNDVNKTPELSLAINLIVKAAQEESSKRI